MPAVILYDGDCAFCSRSVRFAFRRDTHARFRFAPLRGGTARRLAPHATGDTVVLIDEQGRVFERSTAALRIARGLRWPWSWLGALGLFVPRALRDRAYDALAKRRHAFLAGAACELPTPELRARMME